MVAWADADSLPSLSSSPDITLHDDSAISLFQAQLPLLQHSVAAVLNWTLEPFGDYFHSWITI